MTGIATRTCLDERRLRSLLDEGRRRARQRGGPVLVSLVTPLASSSPLAFFGGGGDRASDRLFWASPDGLVLTGVGVTWTFEGGGSGRFADARAAWDDLKAGALIESPTDEAGTGPILMGGFAFDPLRPSTDRWAGYPDGRLVLPRFLMTTRGLESWLTVNTLVWPDTDPAADALGAVRECRELIESEIQDSGPESGIAELAVEEAMSAFEWKDLVRSVVGDLRRDDLEKVVLAREVRAHSPRPFDVARALDCLRRDHPSCFTFAVARGQRCFLGATPERLVRLQDGIVETTALAGSIARGTTAETDRELGEALVASDKDQEEHAIVVRALRTALAAAGVALGQPTSPELMKLRNVQHLRTILAGRIARDRTLLDLLQTLHPTPAVGGFPREAALALIREREGIARGWYAGPVGWMDAKGEGEFAVAIRSALVEGAGASAFAGCGIVADSDPEREYAESSLKLRPILSALKRSVR